MARTWKKTIAKIVGYGLLALLAFAALALTFTVGWRPVIGARIRPLTARKFKATPERLRRGDYLTHAVIPCFGCLPYVDAFGVALAAEGPDRVLVTADFDFKAAARDVKIEFLPAR